MSVASQSSALSVLEGASLDVAEASTEEVGVGVALAEPEAAGELEATSVAVADATAELEAASVPVGAASVLEGTASELVSSPQPSSLSVAVGAELSAEEVAVGAAVLVATPVP